MVQIPMARLGPSPEQHKTLCQTIKKFNEACDDIASISANMLEIPMSLLSNQKGFWTLPQLMLRTIFPRFAKSIRDASLISCVAIPENLAETKERGWTRSGDRRSYLVKESSAYACVRSS